MNQNELLISSWNHMQISIANNQELTVPAVLRIHAGRKYKTHDR
jgi:hypothetical protein